MSGLMAFHAHPDDETTSTGGTLARYADRGEDLVVVTATDGAEGEIHNYDNPDELKSRLTELRAEELAAALKVLGVSNHEFLGYRDSGMMGTDPNADERCFWQADFMEATGRLIKLIRKYQPEVMVIYDPFGGYGHPDHIQVHRIGLSAYWGASDLGRFPLGDGEELWRPSKLYWSAWPRTRVQGFAKARLEAGLINEEEYEQQRHGGTPDEMIDAWIDVKDVFGRKEDAWRAHRTQIPEDWFFFQVPADVRPTVFGLESFVRVFSDVDVQSPEDDLFNGLR
ncbi:MAG: PIG-L family deacetylase [Acidimicrobiia bacterium]|nr:PIG-L family deacetylase [Acidimicrobiia bacterium]MDH5420568.1 PIG-L family deacetylase [Acidimicrobiia bacterium]MDH5502699.1 PIG-L family deacetylase [Acidimicrobiia bacterium]